MRRFWMPLALFSLALTACEEVEETPTPSSTPEPTPTAAPEPTATATPELPSSPTPEPTATPCSDCDDDGAPADQDCNDQDPTIFNGAPETSCDGIDQDCNGVDGTDAQPLVCLDGSCEWDTISQGLKFSTVGSTVLVCPGTYLENNVEIEDGELTLKSVAGPVETIIDGGSSLASTMRFVGGSTSRSYGIEGFTLKGGAPLLYGGGLYVESSSPLIQNVIIENNTAGLLGAGVYIADGSPIFKHAIIRNNATVDEAGGVYLFGGAPVFEDTLFQNNSAPDKGGAFSMDAGTPIFRNCTFDGNSAQNQGGAFELQGTSKVEFYNSVFINNYSELGHVLYFNTSGASVSFINSVVANNGLLAGRSTPSALPSAIAADSGTLTIENSVVAYNAGCNVSVTAATLKESNSLYYSTGNCNAGGFTPGSSSLTVEPKFQGYVTGLPANFHPAKDSPLVNAGKAGTTDMDGSALDMGIYGGELGASWDRDQDGLPDYFWPGACGDVPAGIDGTGYDCNDLSADGPVQ